MNEHVDAQLRRGGWFPGRQVNYDEAVVALRTEGYALTEAVRNFLSEYTGLTVESEQSRRAIWFDAARAARGVDPDWPHAYAEITGCEMVPVGEYSHMTIYLASDGYFYGGFDNEFGRLASNVRELLDRLLNSDRPPSLDMTVPD